MRGISQVEEDAMQVGVFLFKKEKIKLTAIKNIIY